ncbi:MAG TPA: hypothetical protein PLM09_04405, partial [Casimicrobiaceae bacterium]|nr:hypothetical protein [Casimicrobiaceae bacterium]
RDEARGDREILVVIDWHVRIGRRGGRWPATRTQGTTGAPARDTSAGGGMGGEVSSSPRVA